MPRCVPENPQHATGSERQVWELLSKQLGADDLLIAGQRITRRDKDFELDVVAAVEGAGIVVLEVKGGSVWHDGEVWRQHREGRDRIIRPVDQARDGKYALRGFVESDPRWAGRSRVRWAHAVVLPHTALDEDFSTPDAPRWSVIDRRQIPDLVGHLRDIAWRQETHNRVPESDDLELIAEILRGRGLPQRDVVAQAAERDQLATHRLTQEQAVILGAIRFLPRVEVHGGAGSGKTFLAVEQTRRLQQEGKRVALLCYSRGLAAYLQRHVSRFKRREQPAYVGTFHDLGLSWGAAPGSENDSDYWENRLPAEMVEMAHDLTDGQRFDAVVVDEAQDFADTWWQPVMAALRDEENGGLYVFSDAGQRVFARYGEPPVPLVPLVLDHNLRNTRQIADTFHPLAPIRMRLLGGDGASVRVVPCAAGEALNAADDEVDQLLAEGWRPQDVALLATGNRHPEQRARQDQGQDAYWQSFWDDEQVSYGHVLGFKGLERPAVVLAVNDDKLVERAREKLYVGLSRAQDQLVVCGDPDHIREIGGPEVARRLGLD